MWCDQYSRGPTNMNTCKTGNYIRALTDPKTVKANKSLKKYYNLAMKKKVTCPRL